MDARSLVVVVEDEPPLRRFMRAALEASAYRVIDVARASDATSMITSHNPALVLLDLGLPDGDGIDLARSIRGWSDVPIIVISARGREEDKVSALDAGADDYLTKPFGVSELLARMRVALRHRAADGAVEREYTFGALSIDAVRRVVRREGVELRLTPTEYNLLLLFARNAGKVLTHTFILREIWGPSYTTRTHYVRVHMAELRKKIERDSARPELIVTEPGVGYRLRG
ncbi:MAG: response regulator [Myxococcales bacterium]|nr:response regulator [Myxococcales bacterium]